MGSLRHFDLHQYIEKYNIKYLVETGTYRGDSIAYALEFKFKHIYTIELDKEFYEYSNKRFQNNQNVTVLNNTSEKGLIEIFTKNDVGNSLFWLDAHLPNFHNRHEFNYSKDKKNLIPLENELTVITLHKNISNDIFIMDDLRIYETGNFSSGNWGDVINAGEGGIDFVHNLLGNTHEIQKLYDNEGYIICTPK